MTVITLDGYADTAETLRKYLLLKAAFSTALGIPSDPASALYDRFSQPTCDNLPASSEKPRTHPQAQYIPTCVKFRSEKP
jgi:hypothetical protein